MEKGFRKLLSVILSLAMILSSVVVAPGAEGTVKAAENGTFTLYYYYEELANDATIYMDIWSSGSNIAFTDGETTKETVEKFWGGEYSATLGKLQPVDDNENWYFIDAIQVTSTTPSG